MMILSSKRLIKIRPSNVNFLGRYTKTCNRKALVDVNFNLFIHNPQKIAQREVSWWLLSYSSSTGANVSDSCITIDRNFERVVLGYLVQVAVVVAVFVVLVAAVIEVAKAAAVVVIEALVSRGLNRGRVLLSALYINSLQMLQC
uniref:Uncharacterized protein n=1 Tax=Glossina pallidipes TaxID=7398 RepID=A0A1B0AK02_GLOPL